MPLPEKEFYSLSEIAARWHTSPTDIRYYATHGHLKVKAWIDEEVIKVFRLKKTEDGQLVPVQAGFTSYKEYAILAPEDLRRVFRGDPAPIQKFTARNGDLLKLYNSTNKYMFSIDDLVVSRAERDRFEQLYTLPCLCSGPGGKTKPCRSLSYAGRPSVMGEVLRHFSERCQQNLLAPSLQQEGDYLAAWAVSNIKTGQTPRPRSIMNAIRTDYRQHIGTRHSVRNSSVETAQQKSAC